MDFGYRRCYHHHGGAVFVRGGQMNAQLSGALDAVENDINNLRDELEQAHARIGNLLAVIHGDGGQYQAEYGDLAATTDAILKWRWAMLHIDKLEQAAQWISIDDGYPKDETTDLGGEYLVILRYPYNRVAPMNYSKDYGFYTGGWGLSVTKWGEIVTHWRPLPPPPEAQS
jgi:hypothetical protein